MKVFLDTNIVIDFYDQRGDFYYPAAVIFDLAHKRKIQLYVSAITFVNAFFILRKSYSREELYQSMLGLASLCEITDVDKEIIKKCLSFERKDFEDSVQYESALLHKGVCYGKHRRHYKHKSKYCADDHGYGSADDFFLFHQPSTSFPKASSTLKRSAISPTINTAIRTAAAESFW